MSTKFNTQLQHSLQKKLKNVVTKNLKKAGAVVQEGYLQLETVLASGVLRFAVLETDADISRRKTELRLNQNDAFVITHIGIFLKKEDSAKAGAGVLQTYPNIQVFPDVATQVANADLIAFWNSRLNIKVGDREWTKGLDMSKSLFIPQSQQASATTYSQRDIVDGMFPIEPIVTLEGQDAIDISLTIPSWSGQLIQLSTAGAGVTIYAVLKAHGFLIRNGSGLSVAAKTKLGNYGVNGFDDLL